MLVKGATGFFEMIMVQGCIVLHVSSQSIQSEVNLITKASQSNYKGQSRWALRVGFTLS